MSARSEQPAPAPSMIGKVVVVSVRGRKTTDQTVQYVGRLASYTFHPFQTLRVWFEGSDTPTPTFALTEGLDISIQAHDTKE